MFRDSRLYRRGDAKATHQLAPGHTAAAVTPCGNTLFALDGNGVADFPWLSPCPEVEDKLMTAWPFWMCVVQEDRQTHAGGMSDKWYAVGAQVHWRPDGGGGVPEDGGSTFGITENCGRMSVRSDRAGGHRAGTERQPL